MLQVPANDWSGCLILYNEIGELAPLKKNRLVHSGSIFSTNKISMKKIFLNEAMTDDAKIFFWTIISHKLFS